MKNITKIFAIALVALGFSTSAFAQVGATKVADASATIIQALSISQTTPLDFGTVGASSDARLVVLGTDGQRTGSTADLIGTDGVAGLFSVTGLASSFFSIGLPADNTVTLTGNGGTPMTIKSWIHDAGTNPALPASGPKTFHVGATLNVNAAQTPGDYTGTYDVTVSYN